jgi:hypothetical protein
MSEYTANDFLKLLRQHAFHNPLQPRVCEICRVEAYRQENTPTVRWSKAIKTVLHPPMPIGIMLGVIAVLIAAVALLLP